jgi:hypothetical protein
VDGIITVAVGPFGEELVVVVFGIDDIRIAPPL